MHIFPFQGLWWYVRSLVADEDGDVADQFLVEALSASGNSANTMEGVERESMSRGGGEKGATLCLAPSRSVAGHYEVKSVKKGNIFLEPMDPLY